MPVDIRHKSDLYNVAWIAWPQALSSLVITLQSMVDLFWIGRLGTDSVAAVALCGNIINVIFGVSGILHVGTVALIARAIGAGDEREASRAFFHSVLLGFLLGAFILAAGCLLAPGMIGFFNVSKEVTELAITYLRVMSVHLMIVFVFTAPAATFAAAGDTLTPLALNSIAVLFHIVLDPVFIFGRGEPLSLGGWTFYPGIFGWGVFGAGFATVISVTVASSLYFFMIPLGRFPVAVLRWGISRIEVSELWRIMRIGTPFAIAHISRPLSTVVLIRVIASFGTAAVAGFGIAMRWYSVNWILLSGLGAACTVLVGQYLGAGSEENAWRVSRRIIWTTAAFQAVSTALYYLYAEQLIAVMDPNPETVRPGADFMIWVVAGFLLSSPGGMCAAAMNGAGDTMPGMIAGVISNWLVKLPLAWGLALVPTLGVDGVWLAMFISLVAEGVMLIAWYNRGQWKKKFI